MASRREEGLKRLEKARREVTEERAEKKKKLEARLKRLAEHPVTLKRRGGSPLERVVIHRFSHHEVILEIKGVKRMLSWDDLTDDSILAAANAMFDPGDAEMQFDRGRFLVARRRWKPALEAFERAVELDAGFEAQVEGFRDMLEMLSRGEAGFRVPARRVRGSVLFLRYDFREADQAKDFTPGLAAVDGTATLQAKEEIALFLLGTDHDAPPTFVEDASLDLTLTPSGPVSLLLFSGPSGGYEIMATSKGCALFRLVPAGGKVSRRQIGAQGKVSLISGKRQRVQVLVRSRRFLLVIDGVRALSIEDAATSMETPPLEGMLGFRVGKGTLQLHGPLLVQGRMDPEDLDFRVGTSEVMLRRALDDDLEWIEGKRIRAKAYSMVEGTEDYSLSADDPYFAFRIKTNDDLMQYNQLKKDLARYLARKRPSKGFTLKACAGALDRMIESYPDVPALHFLRAQACQARQEYAGSRAGVAKALELFPEFAEALVLQASYHRKAKRFREAGACIDRALQALPDYTPAYLERAFVRYLDRSSSSATTSFEEDLQIALALDPANEEAVKLLRVLKLQAKGPRDLGCRFDYTTKRFHVTTDISVEVARRYAAELEAAFGHFALTFKEVYDARPFPRPRVAIFKTAENYYTYYELVSESRGERTGGVFRRALNEFVFFESPDRNATLQTLHHEQFHHFMSLLSEYTPPYWYNEGMAEYMGALRVEEGKVAETAMLVPGRLRLIQHQVRLNRVYPFSRIMTETPREFYGRGISLRYSQAWSMIHFFHNYDDGKYRPLLDRYLKAFLALKTPEQCYEEVFAPRVEKLEEEWKGYVKGLKLPGRSK